MPVVLITICISFSKAYARKSEAEEDADNLREEKKLLAEDKKDVQTLERQLEKYQKALDEHKDPGGALTGSCGQVCAPYAMGGSCPDLLFIKSAISFPSPVKVDTASQTLSGCSNVTWIDIQNSTYPDISGRTMCERVVKAIDGGKLGGIAQLGNADCETQARNCKYVKLPKEIERLQAEIDRKNGKIESLKDRIADLQKDVEHGCDDCGNAYYQREPTKAESTAMVLGSIFPYFSAGMSGYLQASSQNKYYSAYSNYLSSCTTIGVPCSGPSYAGVSSAAMGMTGMSSGTIMGGYSGMSSMAGISAYSGLSGYYGSYGSTMYGGSSIYGGLTGLSSLYNGYNTSSQYSQLYAQSLANQMMMTQQAASTSQSSLLAQQQLYSAQSRYSQIQQSSGSIYGSIYGTSYGSSYTGSYGSLYGTTSNTYSLLGASNYLY